MQRFGGCLLELGHRAGSYRTQARDFWMSLLAKCILEHAIYHFSGIWRWPYTTEARTILKYNSNGYPCLGKNLYFRGSPCFEDSGNICKVLWPGKLINSCRWRPKGKSVRPIGSDPRQLSQKWAAWCAVFLAITVLPFPKQGVTEFPRYAFR